VFFVDGSRIPKSKEKSESSDPGGDLVAHLGAAVVYKSFKSDQGWQERYITLPSGPCSTQAELAAIAEGLSDATKEVILLRDQDSKSPGRMDSDYKVTVFSDCTSALAQIDKLRTKSAATDARLRTDPISCKFITRSQYLRRTGVHLELRWVPGHSKVEGIIRANTAARHAAMNQDIGVPLDEGLRLIEVEGGLSITNKQDQNNARLEGKL
jgi:ribonuclease HI